ncbi:MAG: peptidase M28, partial [Planctomycetota bacterium]|nr:peptidase M28 [Planctomycetota bacterium]
MAALVLASTACKSTCGDSADRSAPAVCPATGAAATQPDAPVAGAVNVDHLILPEETHFARLWQLTTSGENAEAYWSFDGTRLSLQRKGEGMNCDRIYATGDDGQLVEVSNGKGTTTCAYFTPDDQSVIYASTHGLQNECPPSPDHSMGYVWALHPEFEIYSKNLTTGNVTTLVEGPGYDAEATVSPMGDRFVFTSTRSGDIELWTAKMDGTDLFQVTDEPGYDGGAFYSHDGEWLIFRSTDFSAEKRDEEIAAYMGLLKKNMVRPSRMELVLIKADGTERSQVTNLGKANFAPSFYPDDKRIIFSSNHHDKNRPAMNFDIFACDLDGGNLEQITFYNSGERGKQFDSFPLFSPNGKYLAFSSNRGDSKPGDT